MKKRNAIFFLALGGWLLTTLLVDLVAVPTIFRNISNIAEAGKVGMIIFSRYNILELLLGLTLVLTSFLCPWTRFNKVINTFLVLLLVQANAYHFYLSPKIITINNELYGGAADNQRLVYLEKVHDYYHELYVSLDKAKILLLLLVLALTLFSLRAKERT